MRGRRVNRPPQRPSKPLSLTVIHHHRLAYEDQEAAFCASVPQSVPAIDPGGLRLPGINDALDRALHLHHGCLLPLSLIAQVRHAPAVLVEIRLKVIEKSRSQVTGDQVAKPLGCHRPPSRRPLTATDHRAPQPADRNPRGAGSSDTTPRSSWGRTGICARQAATLRTPFSGVLIR